MQQLENVVTEKIAEIISARSEIGDLRRKVDSYEQETERWKKKQQLLQKMCMDLNTVMKRFIVDKQNSTKDKVAPIKITRSVGLQVSWDLLLLATFTQWGHYTVILNEHL